MVSLLQSWKESLTLFAPKNVHLFFLVTLKTILNSYKILLHHFWWLFALNVIIKFVYLKYGTLLPYFWIILSILHSLTIFCLFIIIRPSLKPKGWNYYKECGKYLPFFIIASILGFITLDKILLIVLKGLASLNIIYPFNFLITFLTLANPLINPFVWPLTSSFFLFLLDNTISLKNIFYSGIRAITMIIYNYPFYLCVFMLFILLSLISTTFLIYCLGYYHAIIFSLLLSPLFLPIPLSFWNNFYIKRLHEQFDLYYPEHIKE